MEWDYKIQPDSDHVAKFQGDRSRELGERVAKQKKTSAVKHKPSGTAVPGGLIIDMNCLHIVFRDNRRIDTFRLSYGDMNM